MDGSFGRPSPWAASGEGVVQGGRGAPNARKRISYAAYDTPRGGPGPPQAALGGCPRQQAARQMGANECHPLRVTLQKASQGRRRRPCGGPRGSAVRRRRAKISDIRNLRGSRAAAGGPWGVSKAAAARQMPPNEWHPARVPFIRRHLAPQAALWGGSKAAGGVPNARERV